MKLYLVSQDHNYDFDTYESFICAAKSKKQARLIYPGMFHKGMMLDWCEPEFVKVQYIGIASNTIKTSRIILSSFNGG